ncbi:MAG TPA: penicillin acylase family protein [Pyrinomonadaceae bacterium]|jgi:penicillin amidase
MRIKSFCAIILCVLLLTIPASFAQTAGKELSVSGLKATVTVRCDERGIAHIEAQNEADLYFAQGFVTAQDRLWQMDLYRRAVRGETAEIFGKAALEEDKRWRRFGFTRIAEETVANMSAESRSILENYARGVNAYIAALDAKTLPPEFQILGYSPREWTPADSIAILKIFDDALSSTWRMDLMKASLMNLPKEKLDLIFDPSSPLDVLLVGKDNSAAQRAENTEKGIEKTEIKPLNRKAVNSFQSDGKNINPEHSVSSVAEILAESEEIRRASLERIGFYAEDLAASNNWVVSGKRTIDGKPLLADDPHLRASQPPIWYLINLSAPTVKVAGVSTPGLPGIIIGHNENIAWGVTNVGPDVQDLYLETFDATGKYKTPNGWETPIVRREEIKVRKGPNSTETETEVLEVTQTRNGVIVLDEAGKKYALKWTAFDVKNDSLKATVGLSKAKNWTEFRNALKFFNVAMQNYVFADAQGNIGWIAAGKVPLRKTGDGSTPYDGATNDGEWTGFIPFDELPQLYNPPEGFITTANQRTVGKSYKYHDLIARAHTVSRAKRLYDLLNANRKVSINDMRDFQFDTFSVINSRFAREVVNQKAASEETLKTFAAWDGRMNADSKAALLADSMRTVFRNKIMNGNLGAELAKNAFFPYEPSLFDRLISEKPKDWLPKEYATYADLLRACETEAKEAIAKQLGADESKWLWGSRVKINFSHPLAVVPLFGAQFIIPPLAQNGSSGAGASPNVGASVSMRFIAHPPEWDATRHGIPTGQSGDPKSAHWKDQLDAWYSGNTPIFPFTKAAVERATKETIVMKPK